MPIRGETKKTIQIPVGKHRARCVGVFDLGIQQVKRFDGDGTELRHQIYLNFETEGGPVIGSTFTLNVGDNSNLGVDIAQWIFGGDWDIEERDEYDLAELLGAYCQIKVGVTQGGNPKLDHGPKGRMPAIFPAAGEDWNTKTELTLFEDGALSKGNINTVPKYISDLLEQGAAVEEVPFD